MARTSIKISSLTRSNILAVEEITPALHDGTGITVGTTRTTATFYGENARQVLAALYSVMATLPTRGHPRASLHAVARKLRTLADAEVAESFSEEAREAALDRVADELRTNTALAEPFVAGETGAAARTAPVVPAISGTITAGRGGEAIREAIEASYGSTFVVWFATVELPKPDQQQLVAKRIESDTFLAVEDWAGENTPGGYELIEIEKHYGGQAALALHGPVDVNLRVSA